MKKILFTAILVFCSFTSVTQEQEENECLAYITRGYFDGFRQIIQSSSGDLRDSLVRERQAVKDLLVFLENAEIESCPSKNGIKLKSLYEETSRYFEYIGKLISDFDKGASLITLSNELTDTKKQYRKFNLQMINALKKETGVKWGG